MMKKNVSIVFLIAKPHNRHTSSVSLYSLLQEQMNSQPHSINIIANVKVRLHSLHGTKTV